MGLSAVVGCSIQTWYIYTIMPRDPRRVNGIDCSHERIERGKVKHYFLHYQGFSCFSSFW